MEQLHRFLESGQAHVRKDRKRERKWHGRVSVSPKLTVYLKSLALCQRCDIYQYMYKCNQILRILEWGLFVPDVVGSFCFFSHSSSTMHACSFSEVYFRTWTLLSSKRIAMHACMHFIKTNSSCVSTMTIEDQPRIMRDPPSNSEFLTNDDQKTMKPINSLASKRNSSAFIPNFPNDEDDFLPFHLLEEDAGHEDAAVLTSQGIESIEEKEGNVSKELPLISYHQLPLCDVFKAQAPVPVFEKPFTDQSLEPRHVPPSSTSDARTNFGALLSTTCAELDSAGTANLLGENVGSRPSYQLSGSIGDRPEPASKTSCTMHNKRVTVMETRPDVHVSKRRRKNERRIGRSPESDSRFRENQDLLWLGRYQNLLDFQERRGHCCIPISFPEDPALARWVKRQRYEYKRYQAGESSGITDSRIRLLESIGFVWKVHSKTWQEKLNGLIAFKKLAGHCNIPSHYAANAQLATWVISQRRHYKLFISGEQSSMTADRITTLNSIGFVWTHRKKLYAKADKLIMSWCNPSTEVSVSFQIGDELTYDTTLTPSAKEWKGRCVRQIPNEGKMRFG